jgi:hypothetical protein
MFDKIIKISNSKSYLLLHHFVTISSLSKNGSKLEEWYKKESDLMVKERLLLILKIKYDNMISFTSRQGAS